MLKIRPQKSPPVTCFGVQFWHNFTEGQGAYLSFKNGKLLPMPEYFAEFFSVFLYLPRNLKETASWNYYPFNFWVSAWVK